MLGAVDRAPQPPFERVAGAAPFVRDAEDPTAALIGCVLLLGGAGVILASLLFDDDTIRGAGLPAIGGILLILTAYFTARNLRQTARASFLDRMMRAAELIANGDRVARTAGLQALNRLADEARQLRRDDDLAAVEAVRAAAREPGAGPTS
jgi:hypothetical protein